MIFFTLAVHGRLFKCTTCTVCELSCHDMTAVQRHMDIFTFTGITTKIPVASEIRNNTPTLFIVHQHVTSDYMILAWKFHKNQAACGKSQASDITSNLWRCPPNSLSLIWLATAKMLHAKRVQCCGPVLPLSRPQSPADWSVCLCCSWLKSVSCRHPLWPKWLPSKSQENEGDPIIK